MRVGNEVPLKRRILLIDVNPFEIKIQFDQKAFLEIPIQYYVLWIDFDIDGQENNEFQNYLKYLNGGNEVVI